MCLYIIRFEFICQFAIDDKDEQGTRPKTWQNQGQEEEMTPAEIWLTIVGIFFLSVWTWMWVSITVKTLMHFRKKKEKSNEK